MHPSVSRLLTCAQHATREWPLGERVDSLSDLQTALEVTPQVFSNWKKRGVSRDGALQAEKIFGVPATWLLSSAVFSEESPPSWTFVQRSDAGGNVTPIGIAHAVSLAGQNSAALISWEAAMQATDLPDQFRVVLRDAALAPDLLSGDELELDRRLPARPGDVVLLRGPDGQLLVRALQERLPGQLVAVAMNPAFAALDLEQHGLTVVAVAVAEIRRRRRSG